MIERKGRSLLGLAALVLAIVWATQQFKVAWDDQLGAHVASRAQPGDIHMFSSSTCTYCDRARTWFNLHRVVFSECFIDQNTLCNARFTAMMAPGTPLLVIRNTRQVGFNAEAVAAALGP